MCSPTQTAYERCKLFVLSFNDIKHFTMDDRPFKCLPSFALRPAPYLSATGGGNLPKFFQRLVDALNLPLDAESGSKDRASRARRELWQPRFHFRGECLHLGSASRRLDGGLTGGDKGMLSGQYRRSDWKAFVYAVKLLSTRSTISISP